MTSTPESLRATVHAVIDGHTKIPYTSSSTDTWDVLDAADEDPLDSTHVLDLYRNRSYLKYGGGNSYYNREHVWPNSYGFPDDGSTNKPYTDCHHLFDCYIGYNETRGNRIFDACSTLCQTYTVDDYNGESGANYSRNTSPVGIWETWEGRRGDVARAMFYMDVRYEGDSGEPDLILTNDVDSILASSTGNNESVAYMGLLDILLQWHEDDPVDDKERSRNDVVYSYQGNRNPFIDHPEWVAGIFIEGTTDIAPGGPPEAARKAWITAVSPNPFNPRTNVLFSLADPGHVRLDVYSVSGKLVRTLLSGHRASGEHSVFWDGTNGAGESVASGVYFCLLRSDGGADTRKLVLVR
ncbi:MAG: endonuclease [Candidatus Eisenbacteria bacterium]|nr:endonuclease [Candidatus Eisenbacteria bacterium]